MGDLLHAHAQWGNGELLTRIWASRWGHSGSAMRKSWPEWEKERNGWSGREGLNLRFPHPTSSCRTGSQLPFGRLRSSGRRDRMGLHRLCQARGMLRSDSDGPRVIEVASRQCWKSADGGGSSATTG